jgi:hypothetical protein
MKKLLIFSLFSLLCTAPTFTQNWFSAEHRWVFNFSGGLLGLNFDFEVTAQSDTIIQGKTCRSWASTVNSFYQLSPKFTYSEGPRAYYFDAQLDSFVKLYDMSLPVGSEVVLPREFGEFKYIIDSIDTVQAGSFSLKRQRVHAVYPFGQSGDWKFDILENIGMVGMPFDVNYPTCSYVFIPDYDCGSIADGFDIKFLCFSTPTGSFNPFSGSCTVVEAPSPDAGNFSIAPNPTSEFFSIQLDHYSGPIQSVALLGMGGNQLLQWNDAALRYPISEIPSGIYLVEVTFSNGKRVLKKLIKS